MPPGRAAAPGEGGERVVGLAGRRQPDSIARCSPTARFIVGREAVLGRRTWLSDDPVVAARQLAERMGPLVARAWLRAVLEEVA